MKTLFRLILILSPALGFAQKWIGQTGEKYPLEGLRAQSNWSKPFVGNNFEEVKDHLLSTIPFLGNETASLNLLKIVESPAAHHYLFQQTINGVKVMNATIKINVDKQGKQLSMFDRSIDPSTISLESFPSTTIVSNELERLYSSPEMRNIEKSEVEEVYYFDGNSLVPSVRIEVLEKEGRYYEMVLDQNIKVIYQNDLLSYFNSSEIDTPVTAYVFMPDPVSSAEVNYGAPYSDQDDAAVAELDAERQQVTMDVDFGGTFFALVSPWIIFNEHTPPTNTPAISAIPEFNFTRNNDRFEEVNAYYHITSFQQHIQNLGFNNLVNYQISVDAHALNGADNSNFNNGFSPPRLSYGDGGVDDAEDSDVIIHEYGHAIMFSAAPGTNGGTERRTLDESNGDYFAASYSRFLTPYGWDNVYSWDGHNEFWQGRMASSTKHYPEDLVGNIYSDADIWSSTIMEIWGDIGRDKADAILMQSAYSYAEGMTMTDAAWLFLQADTLLFSGENFTEIHQRMFNRGFIPWVGIGENESAQTFSISNTNGFANGESAVMLRSNKPMDSHITVSDIRGRILFSDDVKNAKQWALSPDYISTSGVYFINVIGEDESTAFKIIKAK